MPVHAMAQRMRMVLQHHLPRLLEDQSETTQPSGHPPHQAGWNDRLMVLRLESRGLRLIADSSRKAPGILPLNGITDQTAAVLNHGTIGCVVLIQVFLGQGQQGRRRKTLVGQDESRGGR